MTSPRVALIAGPTASGKSRLALHLAMRLQQAGQPAVIVNADASQVYRDIPILSAQPTPEDRAQVPHHLYGSWDGATACDAAQWATAAREIIANAHGAGAVLILVGGTGLYLRTLLDGIAPVPPIDDAIRQQVRTLDAACAHAELEKCDPSAAARLHASDTTRVRRALEVMLSTGRPLADWQRDKVGGIGATIRLTPLILLPPREWLRTRCDARFDAMLDAGGMEEVRALLARNLSPTLPVMRAIGVPELAAVARGSLTLDEARERAKAATRQYAKRQYTWFRHQPPADWTRDDRELNDSSIDNLVIKLHELLLTS